MKTKMFLRLIGSVYIVLALAVTTATVDHAHADQKKIIIAVKAEPDTLDLSASRLGPTSEPIGINIVEKLIGISPEGDLIPGLAKSWKASPDGKEIVFELRKGVKFHSGDLLSAKDVEFTHNRAKQKSATYKRMTAFVEKLEVIDDYRFKFVFNKPDIQFLMNRGGFILSKAYYERVGEEKFAKHPVGTGPYQFVEWEPGQYVELTRNEEYWGSKPTIKDVRFRFIKEDVTRVSMLKAGEADMIVACPFPMVGELENGGYGIIKVPTHPTPQIMFHIRNPKTPWYHKKVRLAIAHAIDTEAITNKLFHGIPGNYARIAPWELGYDPMLKPYKYDPKKAKRLLAEAGYPNGFDMPLYYMVGRIANQKETVEVVALYLKAVGINVKVQGLETVKVIKLVKGEWHPKADVEVVVLFALPTAHWADPTQALIIAFSSNSWGSLYFRPELDVLINEARTTLEDEKRGSLIRKAFQVIHDDVGSIVIWANMTVFATQKNIAFKPTRKQPYPLVPVKNITFK